MQALFFYALAAMLSSTCFARIGETLEECIARYGEVMPLDVDITDEVYPQDMYSEPPEVKRTKDGFAQYGFEKAGIKIGAVFYDGKAAFMVFWKTSENEWGSKLPLLLTDTEITTILQANSLSPWKRTDAPLVELYETQDQQLTAEYIQFAKCLKIQTNEMAQLLQALQRKREAQNLKGF